MARLFTQEQLDEFEAAMTPKQKKVVNFLVGKSMAAAKQEGKNFDPQAIRSYVIERLVIETHEEEAP